MPKAQITNYEINQQAYLKVEPLTDKKIKEEKNKMIYWVYSASEENAYNYIGVLCRDRHDYTLVHAKANLTQGIQEVIEILNNRGEIVDIMYVPNENYYQIWVRECVTANIDSLINSDPNFEWRPQVWMYIVFDATDWVVEV